MTSPAPATLSDLTRFLEGRNGGHPVRDPCGYAMDLIVSLEGERAAEANEVAALKGARTRRRRKRAVAGRT